MSNTENLKVPLIVGVCGHRDIATSEEELRVQIQDFWTRLREEIGADTPVILLSAIAVGADHLAVKYLPDDVKYCVVFPFSPEEYKKGYSEKELEDFNSDLNGAYKCIYCNGENGDYGKASDYIRTHSDILMTFWDGYESRDSACNALFKGGTYYFIRQAFNIDALLLTQTEKAHLVVNFPVTRKLSHFSQENKCLDKNSWGVLNWSDDGDCLRFTPGLVWDRNSEIYKNIKSICLYNSSPKNIPEERNYLYSVLTENYPEQYKVIEDDFLRFEYLDSVAMKYQKYHKREFFWIMVISIAAGILGQLWGDFTFSNDGIKDEIWIHCVMGLSVLMFFAAICVAWITNKKENYKKYVYPRVLAELMRLKIFWRLSNIKEEFFGGFLKKYANFCVAGWICNWEVASPPLTEEENGIVEKEVKSGFPMIREAWINDQRTFFKGYLLPDPNHFFKIQSGENMPRLNSIAAAKKIFKKYFRPYSRLDGWLSSLKKAFFWGGIFFTALLLVIYLVDLNVATTIAADAALKRYRELVAGIGPFLVATLGWLLEKKQWEYLEKRYLEQYALFNKAYEKLPELKTPERQQKLIRELMECSYQESIEWENIKKGTPPEPML